MKHAPARSAVFAAVLLGLAVTGCAAPDPIRTASGKPDVVLRGVDRACIKEGILNSALSNGWTLKSSSDLQLVLQRPAPPSLATTLMTTGYGPPEQRVVLTLAPTGADLRVVIDAAVITNAGTMQERSQPVRATQADQENYEGLARRAETRCRKS